MNAPTARATTHAWIGQHAGPGRNAFLASNALRSEIRIRPVDIRAGPLRMRGMHSIVVSIETTEGTYSVGCLAPNPQNREPQRPLLAERYESATKIPPTVLPLAVAGIEVEHDVVEQEGDGGETEEVLSPAPARFHVFTVPLPGSQYHEQKIGLIATIEAEQVLRWYLAAPIDEVREAIREALTPEEEPEPMPEEQEQNVTEQSAATSG